MTAPMIGICAAVERARFGPWDVTAVLIQHTYVRRVQAAGGAALLLAPDDAAAVTVPLLDRLDGLLIAGGADLDAASYGAAPYIETRGSDPGRDGFEMRLVRGAIKRDLPLLGVCRGAQLFNVATGGTLNQHLPETLGSDRHRPTPGVFAEHRVRLQPGSRVANAAGGEILSVQSHHHQGVDKLGAGLVASGWAVEDDSIEAIELPGRKFALGILWHPEEADEDRLIPALVSAAES